MRRRLLASAALIVAVLVAVPAAADTATVTLDPAQRFQTIAGWETMLRVSEYNKVADRFDGTWHEFSDAIFDKLVNDAGINRVRLEIRSGAENPVDYFGQFAAGTLSYSDFKTHFYQKINDNDDPFTSDARGFQFSFLDYQVERMLLPIRDRLAARGERLFINLNFVDFKSGARISDFSPAAEPEEYAEFIAATMQHLRDKYDLVPDALEVVLEPEHTADWRAQSLGPAAAAAISRLDALGMRPEIILPSTLNAKNAVPFFKAAIQSPGVLERMGAISYHRYAGAKAPFLAEIRTTAEAYGIRAEMLEFTKGDTDDLISDLTETNAAAWNLFSIAGQRGPGDHRRGNSVLLYFWPDTGVVDLSHQGRVLGPLFREVRMNAVRIGAKSDSAALAAVAFENTDQSQVLLLRSQSTTADSVTVTGLARGAYRLVHTSTDAGPQAPITVTVMEDGRAEVTLPPFGIAVMSSRPEN